MSIESGEEGRGRQRSQLLGLGDERSNSSGEISRGLKTSRSVSLLLPEWDGAFRKCSLSSLLQTPIHQHVQKALNSKSGWKKGEKTPAQHLLRAGSHHRQRLPTEGMVAMATPDPQSPRTLSPIHCPLPQSYEAGAERASEAGYEGTQ